MVLQVTVPSKQEIDHVLGNKRWWLGNKVLYDLCKDYPSQTDPEAITAKFWLIGRAYAATVERRRTSKEKPLEKGENFYDHRLVPAYRDHTPNFDELFKPLYAYKTINDDNILDIMKVHNSLTQVLDSITYQWKRSLASKYLHFHFPDLYFIYDSRADNALRNRYVPNWSSVRLPNNSGYDKYYYKFCLGLMGLRDAIQKEHDEILTPRMLDDLLLGI